MDSKTNTQPTYSDSLPPPHVPPPPYGSSEDVSEGVGEVSPFIVSGTSGIRTRQPAMREMMTVTGPPPNPLNLPVDQNGQRAWSHGLFDCSEDCGTFCQAFWCTPCVYGRNKSRLDWLNATGNPHPAHGRPVGTDCGFHLALSALLGVSATSLLQAFNRSRVRSRYAIRGNCVTDCLASTVCSACQLTQESRELAQEEQALRADWGGVDVRVYSDEEGTDGHNAPAR